MTTRCGDVEALRGWLVPNPALARIGILVDRPIHLAAEEVLAAVPFDSAELTAGLRKLLEVQDCFVRAALAAELAGAVVAELPAGGAQ